MKQPLILRKWESVLSAACIIVLAILAYLLLASQLGYYRDDWYMIWAAKTGGIGRLFQMFKIDRPFMGLVSGVSYWLVGDSILAWQFYAVFLRILSGLGFLWLIRLLWPDRKIATLSMAAVFIVYPGFFQQTNALTFSNHFISYALSIYSVLFTLLAYRQKKIILKWLLIILSIATAAAYLLIYEYMIGMEMVRVMLLAYSHYQSGIRHFWQNVKQTAVRWLPSAALLAAFLVWRVFIFKSTRYATDVGRLGKVYLQNPFGMGLRLIVDGVRDFFETVYLAWFVPLYQFASQAEIKALLAGVGVAMLGAGVVAFYWFAMKTDSDSNLTVQSSKNSSWIRESLVVGGLWILLTILPVVFSERQVLFQNMLDRYTLHVSAGVAIFLVASVLGLFTHQRVQLGFVVGLVAIGLITNYLNGANFARYWSYQREAWWQVAWRVPDLREGTALILNLPTEYRLSEGYEVWAPANLIFQKDPETLFVAGEVLNSETLVAIDQPATIQRTVRTIITTADFKNGLMMSMNDQGCLHIYDNSWLGFPAAEEPMIRLVARNSWLKLIDVNQPDRKIPAQIFGAEPPHGWCYYYQKASLAKQRQDWEEVVRLGNEAASNGLQPDSGYEMEWMPFYEGYAYQKLYDQANELGNILKGDESFKVSFCKQFDSREALQQMPDRSKAFIIENLCY